MSSTSSAIKQIYGVSLLTRSDGQYRHFMIDRFRIGFVLAFEDCSVFGCMADGLAYSFSGGVISEFKLKTKENQKIEFERTIVEFAKGLIGSGESLSIEDEERLEMAVKRLADLC